MVKLILSVPHNFNTGLFCHIVTEVVNNSRTDCGNDIKTDYDLGDFVSRRPSATDYFSEYEIDADLIDFETVGVIQKMQELCPLVDIYCENDGKPENNSDPYSEDYFADACYELFKAKGIKHLAATLGNV